MLERLEVAKTHWGSTAPWRSGRFKNPRCFLATGLQAAGCMLAASAFAIGRSCGHDCAWTLEGMGKRGSESVDRPRTKGRPTLMLASCAGATTRSL